jgi:phytoene dehydrogenase-like protein
MHDTPKLKALWGEESMPKSVIIIGGGIAGLAAGCYAQMNGFNSEIYEMHSIAGGLCTSWQRKGFTFDLCIEWLVGSSPRSALHALWEELGAVQGRQFINYAYFNHTLDERGNRFISYTDPDKLRDHMLSFSREDEALIIEITDDIKTLMKGEMFDPESMRLSAKYYRSVSELAARFTNPVLGQLFKYAFDWYGMSAIVVLRTLAWMGRGDAGYPIGGSRPFAQSIEERYLTLGGTISYKSQVDKILVEGDTAVGVRLADGTERRGDIVLSAADGFTTIFKWLDGKYSDDTIKDLYETLELFPPIVFVSLGINGDYSQEPHWLWFSLKTPIEIGGEEIHRLWLRNHSIDKTMAPEGKTVFTLMIPASYDYWAQLEDQQEAYLVEKKRIEGAVIGAISELYPDIRNNVEVVDVATPLTFERYTGNWRASYEGWLFTKKAVSLRMPLTLPGLSNFYMAGHWVAPGGGLPAAAITARAAVELMCNNEKIRFTTSKP